MTAEERKLVKTLSYGTMYGKGAVAFASDYDCSLAEAKEHIAKYKSTFSGVFKYKQKAERECEKREGVWSLTGRKVMGWDVYSHGS